MYYVVEVRTDEKDIKPHVFLISDKSAVDAHITARKKFKEMRQTDFYPQHSTVVCTCSNYESAERRYHRALAFLHA